MFNREMKYQISLFIFAAILALSTADRSVKDGQDKDAYDHLRNLINAQRKRMQQKSIVASDEDSVKDPIPEKKEIEPKRAMVFFDGKSDKAPGQEMKKNMEPKRAIVVFDEGEDKKVEKRDTQKKDREDRRALLLGFKNGQAGQAGRSAADPAAVKHREDKTTLRIILKNGELVNDSQLAKQREDKRAIIVFKNGEQKEVQRDDRKALLLGFKNGAVAKDVQDRSAADSAAVKHREDKTTLRIILKNGELVNDSQQAKQREDKRAIIVFKNGEQKEVQREDKSKTLRVVFKNGQEAHKKRDDRKAMLLGFKNGPVGDKRAPAQNDALLDKLRERYEHLRVAKRSIPVSTAAEKKDEELKKKMLEAIRADHHTGTKEETAILAASRREAIREFLKNRRAISQQPRSFGWYSGKWTGVARKKRDIAATVVGTVVSSVVSNLMKNVEESVVQAETEAAKQVQADLDSDAGRILAHGDLQIAQDIGQHGKPAAPIANEAVPLPFAPVKAHDVPQSHAPIQADVEVVVGNTNATTTTTVAPAGDKKGFFATLFNSFKLFFGTVTNSVGGFFIDMGSRITNFVEKRIKV